jgi:hypothetical protein
MSARAAARAAELGTHAWDLDPAGPSLPVALLLTLAVPGILIIVAGEVLDRIGPWATTVAVIVAAVVVFGLRMAGAPGGTAGFAVALGSGWFEDAAHLWVFAVILVHLDRHSARWFLPILAVCHYGLAYGANAIGLWTWGPEAGVAVFAGVAVVALVVARPLLAASRWTTDDSRNRGTYLLVARDRYLLRVMVLMLAAALISRAIGRAQHPGGLAQARVLASLIDIGMLVTVAAMVAVFPMLLARLGAVRAGVLVAGVAVLITVITQVWRGPDWLVAGAMGAKGMVSYFVLAAWVQVGRAQAFKGRMVGMAVVATAATAISFGSAFAGPAAAGWVLLGLGSALLAIAHLGSARPPPSIDDQARVFE